ncbi:MAG TPA: hypothetical protein VIY30_16095 [Burkholderiaceae bacterium]
MAFDLVFGFVLVFVRANEVGSLSHAGDVMNTIDGFTWRVLVTREDLRTRGRNGAKRGK